MTLRSAPRRTRPRLPPWLYERASARRVGMPASPGIGISPYPSRGRPRCRPLPLQLEAVSDVVDGARCRIGRRDVADQLVAAGRCLHQLEERPARLDEVGPG